MESIRITTGSPDLEGQLHFLVKQEFHVTYYQYRAVPYFLIGWTALVVALWTLTNTDSFITLKAIFFVLTLLLWVAALIFYGTVFIKWLKRKAWIKSTLKERNEKTIEFTFAFDEKSLHFTTNTYKTELHWEHYKYWCENNSSVFLFPENSLYDAIYYSRSELGEENYDRLKQIAKEKLIDLKQP